MTMSDYHDLRPMAPFTADLDYLDAPRPDLTDFPCTSAQAVKHTYESVFGDDSNDDTLVEAVPAKRARLEETFSKEDTNVEEWNYLLVGLDLPPSVIPDHKPIPVDFESGSEENGEDEAVTKEPQDCHDFYGELKWCDEIVAKLEAQLARGHDDEQERMIRETEEMVDKVVQEHEQERARQKLMQKKNRDAKKILSQANKEKPLFCCFICNKGFLREDLVQEHVNEVHLRNSTRYPHKCPHCHMRFAHMPNMYRHMTTHNRDTFKCKECPYEFKSELSLEIHVTRVHSSGDVEVVCDSCHSTFKHEDELKRHEYYCKNKEKIMLKRKKAKAVVVGPQAVVSPAMSTYSASSSMSTGSTGSNGRPTKDKSCPYCLDVFASMQSRNRHIGRKHPEQKDSAETANHIYFKVDSPDLPYACIDCGKRFASSASMNTHKKRIHEKKLDHACYLCSKAYPLGSELRKHLRRVHNMAELDAQDLTTF